jgi:hypothetical protein
LAPRQQHPAPRQLQLAHPCSYSESMRSIKTAQKSIGFFVISVTLFTPWFQDRADQYPINGFMTENLDFPYLIVLQIFHVLQARKLVKYR